MAVLIPPLVQIIGMTLLSVGFGLWLGWAALFLCAGVCVVLFGIAIEPDTREVTNGSEPAD